ncbi:aminotransferase-like domain-containing protein [Sinorhizobium meliloti]|uniref:aminotransferase-like domain-containing protein n=1 Tax=Rhizobium meliloti TaxID=382 RepID=UPI0013E3FB6A|nr:PLP-dependent aminotransferase family protein [Sinorhizobium meliloti]
MNIASNNLVAPTSLIRTTPPTPTWLGDVVGEALDHIKATEDLSYLMRTHKFQGTDEDKAVGANWLAARFGTQLDSSRIIVTNGTQNALFLTLNCAVGRGNIMLAEDVGYYGVRKLAKLLGIEVVPVKTDSDGPVPDAFQQACDTFKPKGLFLTPTLHNPTTRIMSLERRQALAEVARKNGVVLIEDDVYGMLPEIVPPPLSALAPDVTWHATGPAKCMAPGLRIGYLVAPGKEEVERAYEPVNTASTWFVSPLSASIMKFWVESGIAARLLGAIRDEARERQRLANEIFGEAPRLTHPDSLFLWLSLPSKWSDAGFVEAAQQRNVVIRPGSLFSVDPSVDSKATRIVLGAPETREKLAEALTVISELVQQK